MGKICCFAGHGKLSYSDEVYKELKKNIERLITKEGVNEFWVGNYGNFDSLSARAVRELKSKYPHIKLMLVIPYLTTLLNEYYYFYRERYDSILMAEIPEKTPIRLAVLKCNEYMVVCSEFLICYVKFEWGGAYKTLEYAKKRRINIINLM